MLEQEMITLQIGSMVLYSDKLELKTLDQIIWMAAAITRSCRCGTASFVLSTGEKLEAPVSGGKVPEAPDDGRSP